MRSKILSGVMAGSIAGVVFGIMMQVMNTPDGMPMMAMVAKVVRSDSLVIGWLYHLFNSALIGAIFGFLFGGRAPGIGASTLWGTLYGLGWWVLGGLVLMPVFLGMPPFAPVMTEMMRPVALGSLVGHLIYGVILGAAFSSLDHRVDVPELRET